MARGDHIFVQRSQGFAHHGIDVGDGTVIHYSAGDAGRKADSCIRLSPLAEFVKGGELRIQLYAPGFDAEETIERAMSRLGDGGYHLIFNNCEHFAHWCATGEHVSAQVVTAGSVGGVCLTAGTAVNGGRYVVAAGGVVPGFSGSGIMSGLKWVGSAVGGGAVAGVVLLGLVPGLVSAGLVNYGLADDDCLSDEARAARRLGRGAAWVGVGTGSAAGVIAISQLGFSGLSAAGISSGLAAIGGVVNGGMAAGVALTIAMPAAFAALFGAAIYKAAQYYYQWDANRTRLAV